MLRALHSCPKKKKKQLPLSFSKVKYSGIGMGNLGTPLRGRTTTKGDAKGSVSLAMDPAILGEKLSFQPSVTGIVVALEMQATNREQVESMAAQ
jgi:hypothetical protein